MFWKFETNESLFGHCNALRCIPMHTPFFFLLLILFFQASCYSKSCGKLLKWPNRFPPLFYFILFYTLFYFLGRCNIALSNLTVFLCVIIKCWPPLYLHYHIVVRWPTKEARKWQPFDDWNYNHFGVTLDCNWRRERVFNLIYPFYESATIMRHVAETSWVWFSDYSVLFPSAKRLCSVGSHWD